MNENTISENDILLTLPQESFDDNSSPNDLLGALNYIGASKEGGSRGSKGKYIAKKFGDGVYKW